jgi:hypothetical protein
MSQWIVNKLVVNKAPIFLLPPPPPPERIDARAFQVRRGRFEKRARQDSSREMRNKARAGGLCTGGKATGPTCASAASTGQSAHSTTGSWRLRKALTGGVSRGGMHMKPLVVVRSVAFRRLRCTVGRKIPRYVWRKTDQERHEALLTNRSTGEYNGYP